MVIDYEDFLEYIFSHELENQPRYKKMVFKLMEWELNDKERELVIFED